MIKPKRFRDVREVPADTFKKFHGVTKSEFLKKGVKEDVGDDQCNQTPPEELVKVGNKVVAKKKPFQEASSAAVKLQKAFQREQEKTERERKAGQDFLKTDKPKQEPVKEQHAEAGRFRPAIPHTVRSLKVASPRKDMQNESASDEKGKEILARHDAAHAEVMASYKIKDKQQHRVAHAAASEKLNKIKSEYAAHSSSKPGEGSAIAKDYKDQEAKRGVGHVRDHVENDDSLVEGKMGERSIDVDFHPTITKSDEPFDPPYKRKPATVTDKSGAKHSPMSRARDLARKAAQKASKPAKLKESESRKAAIVKDAAKGKKKTSSEDTFQPEPQLSSTITKNY